MMVESVSKVEQITSKVLDLINEEYQEGGRLPSEPTLARILGVSRSTIRQAVERLVHDGLLIRKHGVGTFVNLRVTSIATRLEEVWDFAEMIREAGHNPGVRHLRLELRLPSPEVAKKLALDPGVEVLETDNVFLADDIPVIYCRDTIPANLVKHAYRVEELHGPVYTFLENRCDEKVVYNITEVLPLVANARIARSLDCKTGTPVHYFDEIGYNSKHIPIIYSEEYYRPEYFSFKVIRKMTTSHHK